MEKVACFLLYVCVAAAPLCRGQLVLPSSTYLESYASQQPFLELGFFLRFGCDVPTTLDQGVSLHIRINQTDVPVTYYTPSLASPSGPVDRRVRLINSTHVEAAAADLLTNSTLLPYHVLQANEPLFIREYVFGSGVLEQDNVQLRFLQLSDIEGGVYQEDEATWSIDNVTVTLWSNQSQSALIVSEHFCNDDVLAQYSVVGGGLLQPPCGETASGKALYFTGNTSSRSVELGFSTADLGNLDDVTVQILCYPTVECDGEPTSVACIEDCCLGDGLCYTVNDRTFRVCVVFGFSETSLTAVERGTSYLIEVGFIKGGSGAGVVRDVTLETVEITAVKGVGADFSIDPVPTSFDFIANGVPGIVRVNFRVDSVALEPDETFRLTLSVGSGLPSGPNVFINKVIVFTIQDRDVVEIGFTEEDYRAQEPDLMMPVVLTKRGIIASDITLTVTPLTVAEAEAQGIQTPNVPPEFDASGLENSRARSIGNLAQDFVPIVRTITIPADEGIAGAPPVLDIPVPILIVDDAVDEPALEYFIASLSIASSNIRPGAVVMNQSASLCVIADDDPISIGFEFPSYTVEEQNGTVRIDDLIFLIKQDNRSTERSFFVTVRAVNTAPSGSSVATLDDDYALIAGAGPGNRNLLLTFNSFEGRLPIPFEVFADREFEGPEAFQLQSASNEEGPAFSFPDGVTVFSSAFVEITDDDRLVVGFERNYTVSEDEGQVEVCVTVINPPPDQSIDFFVLFVSTVPGTADEEDLSISSDPSFNDILFIFDNFIRRFCFNVTIFLDDVYEDDEVYQLQVADENSTRLNTTYVTILDASNVTIGFAMDGYNVSESNSSVTVTAEVLEGQLGRDISLLLSTSDGSGVNAAIDGTDYIGDIELLVFSEAVVSIDFSVQLVNDVVFEVDKFFTVALSAAAGGLPPRVTLSPEAVNITIVNDDEMVTQPSVSNEVLSTGALAGIGAAGVALLVVLVLCLVLIVWCAYRAKRFKEKRPIIFTFKTVDPDAVRLKNFSKYQGDISDDLLIAQEKLRLLDSIGQGEFGVVYKAHLITPSSTTLRRMSEYRSVTKQSKQDLQVAVKTLHSFFSDKDVAALMDEFLRMKDFDHHNVLTILGVCVDAGAAPYIVMPYMSNGSLLEFVRDNRDTFVITDPLDTNLSFMTTKMINICLQICKGMEYLASNNVIHRDLAARNCMISGDWVVKVADFGLSMTGYANTYTKMKKEADTRLPIKWMAPEAFDQDKFSEKSDVWSFGVTCWEVYSGGSTPYPGMNDPKTLVDFIHGGGRLDKPTSITCSDEMFELLLSCWEEGMQTRPSFSQLVQRIETVLGMVSGYVQLTEAPLQQLSASGDKNDKNEDREMAASDIKSVQVSIQSETSSIRSADRTLAANEPPNETAIEILPTDLDISVTETTV